MSIGILDADLFAHTKLIRWCPNLEAMKLYNYCLQKGQLAKLLNQDDLQRLNEFEEIYYFQNTDDAGMIFNKDCLTNTNIYFMGRNFNNGVYKPFRNLEIERTAPSLKLYNDYLKKIFGLFTEKYTSGTMILMYDGFVRTDSPVELDTRAFTGNNTWVYDENIMRGDDGIDRMIDLKDRNKNGIIRYINPVRIYKPEQIDYIIRYGLFNPIEKVSQSHLEIYFPQTPEEFNYLLKCYKDYFIKFNIYTVAIPIVPPDFHRVSTEEDEIRWFNNAIMKMYYGIQNGLLVFPNYRINLNYKYNSYFYLAREFYSSKNRKASLASFIHRRSKMLNIDNILYLDTKYCDWVYQKGSRYVRKGNKK